MNRDTKEGRVKALGTDDQLTDTFLVELRLTANNARAQTKVDTENG